MTGSLQLMFHRYGFDASQVQSLQHLLVRNKFLPLDVKNFAQAALVELFQPSHLLTLENPGLCSIEEAVDYHRPVNFQFGGYT